MHKWVSTVVVVLLLVWLSASSVLGVYDLFSKGYSDGYARGLEAGQREADMREFENFTLLLRDVYFNLTGDYWYERGWAEGYASVLKALGNTTYFYTPIVVPRLSQRPVIEGTRVRLSFNPAFGSRLGIEKMYGTTRSMSPAIEPGYVLIVQYRPKDLKIGEIVGFPTSLCRYSDGTYSKWVHRIVGFKKMNGTTYLVTKGDANPKTDECNITSKDVSYRVVAIIPSSLD
jgi:signal peptidase I